MDPTCRQPSWGVKEEFCALGLVSAAVFDGKLAMVKYGDFWDLANFSIGPAWTLSVVTPLALVLRHSDPRDFYTLEDALYFCLLHYYSIRVGCIITKRQSRVVKGLMSPLTD